jgi:hypothetical protein
MERLLGMVDRNSPTYSENIESEHCSMRLNHIELLQTTHVISMVSFG